MLIEYLLGLITFCTSLVAGIFGFGGGLLLIAVLPAFMPASAVIPAHGVTQLSSNFSRMLFSVKHVQWRFFPKFVVGSILGAWLVVHILSYIPIHYLPLAIGIYMLLNLWSKPFANAITRFESFYIIGFLQTGLGLVVGATGPLVLTVLTKHLKSREQIIATSALCMCVSHLAKIPVYLAVTEDLFQHIWVMIAMIVGAILGSFVSTKVKFSAGNDRSITVIKWLVSLLALRMIVDTFLNL